MRRRALLALTCALGCSRAETPPAVTLLDAGLAEDDCLRFLDSAGVGYRRAAAAGGMRTPVEITSPLAGVSLEPRGRSPALMDCALARALVQARPIFEELGVQALSFSAAFDNRTRRDSDQLSAHAFGLAIDVHAVRTKAGTWEVLRDYEPGVGAWRGLKRGPGALEACLGQPRTPPGRALRTLACRLKLHPAFAVIVTPDDNSDHRNHLHVEAAAPFYPPRPGQPPALPPTPPPPPPDAGRAASAEAPRPQRKRKRAPKKKRATKKKRGAKLTRP